MDSLKNSIVRTNQRINIIENDIRNIKKQLISSCGKANDVQIEPTCIIVNSTPIIEEKDDSIEKALDSLLSELQVKTNEMLETTKELKELEASDDDLESINSVNTVNAIEQLDLIDEGLVNNPDVVQIHHNCGNCAKEKYRLHKKLQKQKKLDEKSKKKAMKESKLKVIQDEQSKLAMQLHRLKS